MRLILVRHGRPDELNQERPHDPPLSEVGHQQSRAVCALLAREGITRIVSSPMLRALQTAKPLSQQLGLTTEVIDGWAEADRNAARYRSDETLRRLGKDEWARFIRDPISYLGGNPQEFRSHVLDALASTIGSSRDTDRVAIFSHGLPINIVLSHILGLDSQVRFPPYFASVTRLNVRGPDLQVISVNECGHHALL